MSEEIDSNYNVKEDVDVKDSKNELSENSDGDENKKIENHSEHKHKHRHHHSSRPHSRKHRSRSKESGHKKDYDNERRNSDSSSLSRSNSKYSSDRRHVKNSKRHKHRSHSREKDSYRRHNRRHHSRSHSHHGQHSHKSKRQRREPPPMRKHRNSRSSHRRERSKRSRTRSPHPLLETYGFILNNIAVEDIPNMRVEKNKLFWDGFQWVTRNNPIVTSFEQTTNTRKVQISNLPLDLGLTAPEIKNFFNSKIMDKYSLSKDPIENVILIPTQNSAAVELTSKDHISKIKAFDGLKLLGQSIKVTSFEDKTAIFNVSNHYGVSVNSSSNPLANSAQTAAQAAAIATAALKGIQGQEMKINLQAAPTQKSPILKISNIVDENDILRMGAELDEIKMDMKEEFFAFGDLIDIRMILPPQNTLGAEAGCVFVEFSKIDPAEKAMEKIKGRKYDNRIIRLVYLSEELYQEEFKPISTSFIDIPIDCQFERAEEAEEEEERVIEADLINLAGEELRQDKNEGTVNEQQKILVD